MPSGANPPPQSRDGTYQVVHVEPGHNRSPAIIMVNATKPREWQRHHHDGSHGVVEERKPGIFVAIDIIPFGIRVRPVGANREFMTIEDACMAADCAAELRGHVCTSACTLWRRE